MDAYHLFDQCECRSEANVRNIEEEDLKEDLEED